MATKPILVGVTGGIGSGKSTVCKIFQVLGIQVYDADSRAKWLMGNDPELIGAITNQFGKDAYLNGQLNRRYLAEKVFNHESELKKLNNLVHPAVGRDFDRWVGNNNSQHYLIKEAALLFESGSYKNLDLTIQIYSPLALRIDRILKRDPYRSKAEVIAIIDKQLTDSERKKLATHSIINDENEMLIPQVLNIHQSFLK
ncbi:MAG: dephospho-CoA kinase [Cyclobacteriaceae bacterium]